MPADRPAENLPQHGIRPPVSADTGALSPADAVRRRLKHLPPEVGAVLLAVGAAGVLLPGPVGTPLLLAGGLVLAPRAFSRIDRWLERCCPALHRAGQSQLERFIGDFERRYPWPNRSAD